MVRNIWAVGRNYAEHAKELGNTVPQASGDPLIFLKAGSGLVENKKANEPSVFGLPKFSQNVHFETELVFRFGSDLKFDAVTIGIDLTARDLQDKLKSQGQPWTLAKSFKESCLLGSFVSLENTPENLKFQLLVNGEVRQKGDPKMMIHSVEKVRQFLIERFPVVSGDLVMTGTPQGVAQVHPGDRLEAEIIGLVKAAWSAH